MINNYVKVAIRNLLKGRLYSFINILGLGLGICICVLILLFVRDEWSFDKFHADSERMYRLWVKEHFKDQLIFNAITPVILGDELQSNFAEVEHITKLLRTTGMVRSTTHSSEENLQMVEPGFMEMFDFQVLSGSGLQALNGVHQLVISETIARKYFGDTDPIGRSLELQLDGQWNAFTVQAVLEDPPSNSSIQYDLMIPFENVRQTLSEGARLSWTIIAVETYVTLEEGVDLSAFEAKLAPFIDDKVSNAYAPGQYIVGFQPITDIHLNTEVPQGYALTSDARYPWILGGIALLILVMACINFTTLSIGRSLSRAKEVGVRKVTGATRGQVMLQFWTEAFVTTGFAAGVGLALAAAALPVFNNFTDKSLVLEFSFWQIISLVLLSMVTGAAAGAYPSVVLSRFSPIRVIRGMTNRRGTDKHQMLRWLVGAQCVISIVLIICTLVIKQQMDFLQKKNLGYSTNQVISVPYNVSGQRLSEMWPDAMRIADILHNDLGASGGIVDVATASHSPGSIGWLQLGYVEEGTDKFRQFQLQQISPNYQEMMQMELAEGRPFAPGQGADLQSVIINETMAEEWGWDNPIGQTLPGPFRDFEVIGVAKDFHFTSLHTPIGPLVMAKDFLPLFTTAQDRNWTDFPHPKLLLKLHYAEIGKTLAALEDKWSDLAPGLPFQYAFVDDQIAVQYAAERRLSSILGFATGLAILIASMGMFGIGLLTVARRGKEIGVRRVLGASASQIILLLNRQFTLLVLIGLLIASPIAWYVMRGWLADFAYRINISPWIFPLAGGLALALVWISIAYQSINAAFQNPVKALRDE